MFYLHWRTHSNRSRSWSGSWAQVVWSSLNSFDLGVSFENQPIKFFCRRKSKINLVKWRAKKRTHQDKTRFSVECTLQIDEPPASVPNGNWWRLVNWSGEQLESALRLSPMMKVRSKVCSSQFSFQRSPIEFAFPGSLTLRVALICTLRPFFTRFCSVWFFSSAASTVCNPPLPDCCCSQTVSYEATGLRKQSDICFLPALVRMNFSSIVGLAEDEIERSKNFLLICKRLSKWFDFRFYLVIAII